jgi:hypothetical protein
MSVSANIDTMGLFFSGPVGAMPQRVVPKLGFDGLPDYDVDYHGEDYAFPPQVPMVNLWKKIRKPSSNSLLPPPRDYVPLKSAQMGSHAEGAALFHAAFPAAHAKLKTPTDETSYPNRDGFIEEHFPGVPPEIMYKKGIRPYPPRPIKIDDIYEPGAMRYKIDAPGFDRSKEPAVSYAGDGQDDLRAMMRR